MQFLQKRVSNCKSMNGSALGELAALQLLGLAALLICSIFAVAEDFSEIIGPVDDTVTETVEAMPAPEGEPEEETIVAPCDPFSDPACREEVELDGGLRYLGRLVEGKPHGMGTMMYPNGDRFEGYFEHGLKMGQGKMTLASGHTFDGFWVRDRLNGTVTMVSPTGDRYQGSLGGNHQPQGQGRLVFASGDQYSGQFAMGKPQGQGVLVFGRTRGSNAGDRYEGQFDRGQRHGAGRYVFADGTVWQVNCQYDRCERSGMVGMFTGRGAPQQGAPADREQRMKRPYRPR